MVAKEKIRAGGRHEIAKELRHGFKSNKAA